MSQKRSDCIFKTQKTEKKKYILNILEQFRESFNFEKKRPKNLKKVQKFLPKIFFKIMLVAGIEMCCERTKV